MIRHKQLDFQKYKDIIFERLNSKYNRLYEQITNICILIAQIFTAYIIGTLAYNTSQPKNFISFNSVTFIVFVVIIFLSFGVGRLEYERMETKRDLRYFLSKLN